VNERVVNLLAERRRRKGRSASQSDSVDPLLTALRARLRAPGDLIPDDAGIVRGLLSDAVTCDEAELRVRLDHLADRGWLRQVVVGRERHLALGQPPPTTSEPAQPASADPAPASAASDKPAPEVEAPADDGFQLRVEIDIETERVLLYRVGLVVSALVAIVLLRGIGVMLFAP
jgi:hypothetical protein